MFGTKNTRYLALLVMAGGLVAGCDSDVDDDEGGSGGSSAATTSSGQGAGTVCYDVDVNGGTGEEACGSQVCRGGEYCESTVGICSPGCRDERDCAQGQFCDLSNANAEGIGLCASPTSANEVPCQTAATCAERCQARATQCMAPADMASMLCGQLCGLNPTESQLMCIETTSCMDLGEAFEQGQPLCGLGG